MRVSQCQRVRALHSVSPSSHRRAGIQAGLAALLLVGVNATTCGDSKTEDASTGTANTNLPIPIWDQQITYWMQRMQQHGQEASIAESEALPTYEGHCVDERPDAACVPP